MPTNPIDWSKCLIYKIISKDPNCNYIYVSSTTDFTRRWREHRSSCNNEKSEKYNYILYKFIRENGGFDNFTMVLVEKFTDCKDRLEARQREQYWIDELKPKLNEQHAFYAISTKDYNKKYKLEHTEYYREYQKKRYENNKQIWKDYQIQQIQTKYICPLCNWIGNESSKKNHFKNKHQIRYSDFIKSSVQEDLYKMKSCDSK